MQNRFYFVYLVILIFSLQISSFAHNLVQDTLTISFDQSQSIISSVRVDTVIDTRNTHPRLLAEYEHTKYIFVPVDLLVLSKNPLNEEIQNAFQNPNPSKKEKGYELVLDEFELSKRNNSMFYPHYQLCASIHVHRQTKGKDAAYIGQLLYETTMRKPFFGDKLKKGFETVSQKWINNLVNDLDSISQNMKMNATGLENFRYRKYYGRPLNMISGVDLHGGSGDWLLDGEILFSHREAKKRFYRDGYNIRYRKSKKYESIEFGLSSDYLYYRLNENFLLRGKSQLMLGFTSWNDLSETRHKLWDAFIGDYSLSQSILYNPIDKSSVVLGLGVSQDVFYIYSKGISFQFSLLLNLGLKL